MFLLKTERHRQKFSHLFIPSPRVHEIEMPTLTNQLDVFNAIAQFRYIKLLPETIDVPQHEALENKARKLCV